MAFARLHYKKDWNNPADFPTHEDSEAQVRLDLQFHPDAVRDYLNDTLLPALEDGRGAAELGTAEGPLQAVLDAVKADLQALAAGGVPSVSQCVPVGFEAGDWSREAEDGPYTLTIARETHRRYGAAFGFNLWVEGSVGTYSNVESLLANARAAKSVRKAIKAGTLELRAAQNFSTTFSTSKYRKMPYFCPYTEGDDGTGKPRKALKL